MLARDNGTVVKPKTQALQDRYDEMSEMINKPPGWLVRSGLSIIGITVIMGLALCWVIRYPDFIEVRATIVGNRPPVRLIAMTEGIVQEIYAHNGDMLHSGDSIMYISDGARPADVRLAMQWVNKLNLATATPVPVNLRLGHLSAAWSKVTLAWENYQGYQHKADPSLEIGFLDTELQYTQNIGEIASRQNSLSQDELQLAMEEYRRNQKLREEQLMSQQDIERSESSVKRIQRQDINFQSSLIENKLRLNQIGKERVRLSLNYQRQLADLELGLREAVTNFKIQAVEWDHACILRSPVSGELVTAQEIYPEQYVQKGVPLATIVSGTRGSSFTALCKVPELGAGNIVPGNPIRIALAAYPPEKWGYLQGTVIRIAAVPEFDENMGPCYALEANLGDSLRTDAGKSPGFEQNLGGIGKITTQNQRLLHRLLGQLYQAWDKMY